MSLLDLLFMVLFAALYFSKHTRLASIVFLSSYVLFLILHNILPNGYTYAASGACHLIIFSTLVNSKSKTYVLVAFLSVALILVNIQGYMDYERYLLPDNYNYAYLILLTVQLTLLYSRAVINGLVDRFNYKRDLVQFVIDSSCETLDAYLYKKEAKK